MSDTADTRPDLVLGPALRRVEAGRATVWVEMARAGTVEIRTPGPAGGAARTFSAYQHHYALVVVDGLEPESATPYEVYFDGVRVWPVDGDPYPAPVIRTSTPDAPVRLLFGSCREASPYSNNRYPPDALDAYAVRLAGEDAEHGAENHPHRPDLLVLLGDQVYADETPEKIRRWLRRRGNRRPDAPRTQVVDFHEYTRLYLDSWTDPEIRWLLSTVPSVMIFDDHEIIDDWNVSAAWRAEIAQESWWPQRIRSGLASYWVYQHLGNLAPSQLGADPVYSAVIAADDATAVLEEFGTRADAERDSYRWSYALDVGRTRLIMLDNRCGRQLEPGNRAMLPEREWNWFSDSLAGDYDHLVIGSSLPWLMPPAIHHLEAASELLAESPRPIVAAAAERLRRAVDLEHWAAFGRSFEALGALLGQIAAGAGGVAPAPATISVLSGDVHHSYVARALLGTPDHSPVHQLTCSPVHNDVPRAVRPAMRLGWSTVAAKAMRALARSAGVPRPGVRWRRVAGPYFGNAAGLLVHHGRTSRVTIEGTTADKHLVSVAQVNLSRPDSEQQPAQLPVRPPAQRPASRPAAADPDAVRL